MNSLELNSQRILSISIVTFLIEKEEFRAVLKSINKAVFELASIGINQVPITIIDNGNQRELLQEIIAKVKEACVDYKLISSLRNVGYGRANNVAIRETNAEYHLILNPDVLLEKNCIVEGLHYLQNKEKEDNGKQVCAVAPYAIDGKGNTQYLCRTLPNVFDLLLRGFAPAIVKKLFKKRLASYELRDVLSKRNNGEILEGVPVISGCFMLCQTEVLKKIGGFDERFFLHFEDVALSIELQKYGNLSYLPSMKIQHFGGNATSKGIKHILIFISSGIKFYNIYGWKFI